MKNACVPNQARCHFVLMATSCELVGCKVSKDHKHIWVVQFGTTSFLFWFDQQGQAVDFICPEVAEAHWLVGSWWHKGFAEMRWCKWVLVCTVGRIG